MSGKLLSALGFAALALGACAAGLLLRRIVDRVRTAAPKEPGERRKPVDLSRFGGNFGGGSGILLVQNLFRTDDEGEDRRRA